MLSMCLLLVFYYMECRRMAKSDISYVIRKSTTGLKAHVSAIDKRVLDFLVAVSYTHLTLPTTERV